MNSITGILFLVFFCLMSGCQPDVLIIPPSDPAASSLTVEEYKLVSVEEDTPDHFEFRSHYLTPQVTEKRMVWRLQNPDLITDPVNQKLAPFGINIEQNPIMSSYDFQVFQEGNLIADHIERFSALSFNGPRDNFVMSLFGKDGQTYLLQKQGVEKKDPPYFYTLGPVYAQDELVWAEMTGEEVHILNEENVLFSVTPPFSPVDMPLKSLWGWENHWVLEISDTVYVDGKSLNKAAGKDKIFHWSLLHDQPFYFFEEDQSYGLHYAGIDLEGYRYEKIVHYNCCEPAMFNPGSNEYMVWFFAQREGYWYYVEAGVYE